MLVLERASLRAAVREYAERCFRHRTPPSVSELATELDVSRDALTTAFRERFGMTLRSYFTRHRIICAKRLLRRSRMNVRDIGARVGYGSEQGFHRSFRRATGMSPGEYRAHY